MSDRMIQRARKILRSETGTVTKEWGGRTTVCLIYPNQYYVGMSNLGFQTIYRLLNDHPHIVCERAFLPAEEDLYILHRGRTRLVSLESQRPLADFDILAFSISFENDFANLLTILEYARIPLESSKRTPDNPIVIAGGVATFLNPEPVADFVDIFLLGEAEEVLLEFMDRFREASRTRLGRQDFFRSLGDLEGAYVPRFYRPRYDREGRIRNVSVSPPFPRRVTRRFVEDIDAFSTVSVIRTPNTEFGNMTLLEVNRGCPRRCRFCAACFLYRPYRDRSLAHLTRAAEIELRKGDRIGLTGAAVSDHPDLESLCEFILSRGGTFSLASVRLDTVNERLARAFRDTGLKTVTLAPEAGSERLRTLLRKGITEEDIFRAVQILLEHEIFNLRLYFLVGIPSETDTDMEAIVQLVRKIKHRMVQVAKSTRRLGRITLSINALVPKPSTPFQWTPFADVQILRQKLKTIRNGLKKEANVNVTHDVPKWGYVQSLLSRGDRRVGKVLLAVHKRGGDWKRALREVDINPDFYVYRERDRDEVFPWDFIDHGVDKTRLREEYERALTGE